MLGGNIFSIAFGRNLDSHDDDSGAGSPGSGNSTLTSTIAAITPTLTSLSSPPSPTAVPIGARGGIPSSHHCIIGRACYVDSLKMTIVACCLALGLAVYASWRDLRKQRKWASRAEGPAVVVWDSEE